MLEIWWERDEMEWEKERCAFSTSAIATAVWTGSWSDVLFRQCVCVRCLCLCGMFACAWFCVRLNAVVCVCASCKCVLVCVCLCVCVCVCVCVWSKCSYWLWFSACGGKLNHFSRPLLSGLSHRKITLSMQPHLHTNTVGADQRGTNWSWIKLNN